VLAAMATGDDLPCSGSRQVLQHGWTHPVRYNVTLVYWFDGISFARGKAMR
jgi:hypothetical protein